MRLLQILVVLSMALGACRVDSNDVETWKSTVKGPSKIKAVALAPKYGPELRIQAAVALVEMDRQDVEGLTEFENTLRKLNDADREKIIAGIATRLEEAMKTDGAADADNADGLADAQVRAKDAAFILLPYTQDAHRQGLSSAIVQWLTADFNGRSLAGKFSAEQIIRTLGSSAAGQLVAALDSRIPQTALIKLSHLIAQIGDDATKAQAGARLVAIEREMESKAFVAWLETRIQEQAKERNQTVKSADVSRAAIHHRETFITTGALPAMSHVADQPVVAERLLEIASNNSQDAVIVERRWRALAALEGKATAAQLDRLLELALNNANPSKVRDYAFDRLGDIRSPKTIARLWPLVQSASNPRERWRAGELVLAIGGDKVLDEFLSRLPTSGDATYEPEELEGYAKRMGQMIPLPVTKLRALLSSSQWWQRVIALRFFERKGSSTDLPSLQRLTKDSTPVKGKHWDAGTTVGKIATSTAQAIRQRIQAQPSS
jgi:hypothetical protein